MIIKRSPRTSSGRIAMVTRLRPSAGARFSQSGFGTTPNIAPPSRRKCLSRSGVSSRLPSCIDLLLQLDEDAMRRSRVDERDERPVRARPRRLVDQADALFLQARQRGGDVVDAQRDVV